MAKKDSAHVPAAAVPRLPTPATAEITAKPPRRPDGKKPMCPKSATHKNTRVYKWAGSDGIADYCVCDDCGHTWKEHVSKRERSPA